MACICTYTCIFTYFFLPFIPNTSLMKNVAQSVKSLPANAGDARDVGSIPVLGRSLREGNGNPLQYSCLENPMDRGARQSAVNGVARVGFDLATKLPNHHQDVLGCK